VASSFLACLMSIKEAAFLEDRLLSSQPEQFQKLSRSDWLNKEPALQKSHFVYGHKK